MQPVIDLGEVVATKGAQRLFTGDEGVLLTRDIAEYLDRHRCGDWGLVSDDDKQANDNALEYGGKLLSAYDVNGQRVWILTEWDRSYTTLMLPEEY